EASARAALAASRIEPYFIVPPPASVHGLPDVDALIRWQIELVAGLHVERLVPGVDILNDAVDPILARAVLVGDHLLALGALTLLFLPRLGVGDEEALVAGQP